MIELLPTRGDDEAFVREAMAVVNGAARTCRVREVIVVRVDNWFGPRWLSYCLAGNRDESELRVPPFRPSRIESERRLVREDDESPFQQTELTAPIHIDHRGNVKSVRHVRVSQRYPDCALVWWSGKSRSNGRGCIMCYWPSERVHNGWYAGWILGQGWHASDCVNVTRAELAQFASGVA